MKLYVYCLAEHIDPPDHLVSGISGARLDVLDLEGLSLLISEFAGDTIPVNRDNVLAHAAVVRSVLDKTTPLPFRFGTVVSDHQLRTYVASHRQAFEMKLADVRGCVEMSVKIISNKDRTDSDSSAEGPGARFLKNKQRRTAQAKEVAEWLRERTGGLVRQEQVSLCSTEKLIVAAAHLIERPSIPEYRDRLAEARKQRPELHFLVSGPWPPYSFANIELEFERRFGVS